jgi:hypothetical protein
MSMKNNKKNNWKPAIKIVLPIIVIVFIIVELFSYFRAQSNLNSLAKMNTLYTTINSALTKGVAVSYALTKQNKDCTANGSLFSVAGDTGWAEFCSEDEALLFPVSNQQQAQQVANQIYSAFGSILPLQEGQSTTNFSIAYNDATNNPAVASESPDYFDIELPESGGFSQTLTSDPTSSPDITCTFDISYALNKPISTSYGDFGLSVNETNNKVVVANNCTAEVSHTIVLYPFDKHGY